MNQPYLGEIRMVGFDFAPKGWAPCDGRLVPIEEYSSLFQLIGTTYGGDGVDHFGLPDLRGRVPLEAGQGTGLTKYFIGEHGGEETVTLTDDQMPGHNHIPIGRKTAGTSGDPTNKIWAASTTLMEYSVAPNPHGVQMTSASMANTGASQAHENMLPFVAVNYIIALHGRMPRPA